MSKAMIITVGTGREGSDIAGAISLAIRREHPDYILFFTSPVSDEKTFPLIDKDVLKDRETEKDVFAETDDVEEIYRHYICKIREVIAKGYQNHQIVVDYTSGTKSMSAALFTAGIALEVGSVNYTAGKRDSGGRVIPGMERPTAIKPLAIFAENRIKEAQAFFNCYQFQAAAILLSRLQGSIQEPSIVKQFDFMCKIIEAYRLWDTFSLKKAADLFGKIKSEGLMTEHPARGLFEKNLIHIHRSLANKYSTHRLVDLFYNIQRRMEEGKYDDAQARIYRLFEYMAQVKLYNWDNWRIETKKVSLAALPENIREKYRERADANGEIENISMVNAFALLEDLSEALGQDFMQRYRQDTSSIRSLLNKRNNSILAHGFTAIEKDDCEQLLEIAQEFLDKYFPEWIAERDRAIFPKL